MKAIMNKTYWTIFGWAATVTLIRTYFIYMDQFRGVIGIGAGGLVEPVANMLKVASLF